MKRKRRHLTAEFKARVALEALKGEKTTAEIARENDIGPAQICEWNRPKGDSQPQGCPKGGAQRQQQAARGAHRRGVPEQRRALQGFAGWRKKKHGWSAKSANWFLEKPFHLSEDAGLAASKRIAFFSSPMDFANASTSPPSISRSVRRIRKRKSSANWWSRRSGWVRPTT